MALRRSTGCGARSHLLRRILAWRTDAVTGSGRREDRRHPMADTRLPLPGPRFPTLRHWVVTCSLHPSRRRSPGCSPWSPLQGSHSGSRRSGSPRSPLPPSMPTRSMWPVGCPRHSRSDAERRVRGRFCTGSAHAAASAGAFLHQHASGPCWSAQTPSMSRVTVASSRSIGPPVANVGRPASLRSGRVGDDCR